MATLSEKTAAGPLKMLLIGESGTGKTGALASLVQAGYEIFILDFDNGTDVLQDVIKDKAQRSRVHIETLTDTGKLVGSGLHQKITKNNPQAFPKALNLLQKWVDGETRIDFGPPGSWDTGRILVVDSLSFLGMAALDYVMAKNGRFADQPWQSDWGEAMRMIEQTLQILYSTEIKCNVIVNTHIDYVTPEGSNITKGVPMALGQKLSPKVGRYFNMMLMTKSRGTGDATKRIILTKPDANIELKCPILSMARELPLESGLATIFKEWNGGKLPEIKKAA